MFRILNNNRGVSLIELVVTMVILGILASLVLPSARMISTRVKEIELRRELREIRNAIDDYHKYWQKAKDQGKIMDVQNDPGYPKALQDLVDGTDFGGLTNYKVKFLRRIPMDPFNPVPGDSKPEDRWNLRSYEDDADSNSWGGQNVFDVSSKSDGTAIDGTKYKDW
jgi:general secretion pathway protein G